MIRRRAAMTRLRFVMALTIVGATALVAGIVKDGGRSPFHRLTASVLPGSSVRSPGELAGGKPTAGLSRSLQPRMTMDTSGFSAVMSSVTPWGDTASLEEIATIWKGPGYQAIARCDQALEKARTAGD